MTTCILSNRIAIFVGVNLVCATLTTAKSTSPKPERNIAELIIREEDSSVAHVHEEPQTHLQRRERSSLLNLLDWIHKSRSALILKLILL